MRSSIDLHGYTVHAAWRKFNSFVTDAYFHGHRSIVVITGHGQIGSELIAWCHQHERVQSCQRMNPNTGAYRVTIVKQPKKTESESSTNQLNLYKLINKYN
jgi:DNA-nicking Smr family endonuclease